MMFGESVREGYPSLLTLPRVCCRKMQDMVRMPLFLAEKCHTDTSMAVQVLWECMYLAAGKPFCRAQRYKKFLCFAQIRKFLRVLLTLSWG